MMIGKLFGCTGLVSLAGVILIAICMCNIDWMGRVDNLGIMNPMVVYRYNKKVNWFGAFVIALFFNLICPVGSVCYWFYKLCTVGRK